jgi:hypothetical protein
MAGKPKQKQDWGSAEAEKALVQRLKDEAEKEKVRDYANLLEYAKQNILNPEFSAKGKVSGYDVAAPYYGEQAQPQLQAASEYAKMLAADQAAKVTVPEEYYVNLQRQVPVLVDAYVPAYNKTKDFVGMPSFPLFQQYYTSNEQNAIKNNFSPQAVTQEAVQQNLMNYWQSTLEHEAGHVADASVSFAKRPSRTFGEYDPSTIRNLGYMAQENHLVTGLGKVQREYYSQTGKRFESPEEFKNFLFDLTQKKDTEEAISGFSEEAKRTLRYQIENAKDVKTYYDNLQKWEKGIPILRGFEPLKRGDPDLLEKSAQLIPALVQVDNRYNSNV